jgi:hypothetical protein
MVFKLVLLSALRQLLLALIKRIAYKEYVPLEHNITTLSIAIGIKIGIFVTLSMLSVVVFRDLCSLGVSSILYI